jgi:hypothetical protein
MQLGRRGFVLPVPKCAYHNAQISDVGRAQFDGHGRYSTLIEHSKSCEVSGTHLSKKEIIRCLKRDIVREICTALRADFTALAIPPASAGLC